MGEITLATGWAWLLAGASAFVLLAGAAEKIIAAVKAAKAPGKKQEAQQESRIGALEEWRREVDRKLTTDHTHLSAIDEGNRVTQRALLALLDHGIDGNNIEQMQHAKEELQEHLINR